MRKFCRHIMLLFVGGAVALLVCSCQEQQGSSAESPQFAIDKQFDRGPLTVHVKMVNDQVEITEKIRLQIDAVADEGVTVTFPALEDALGAHEFDLAASRRQPEKLLDGGKVLQRYDYELDPLMPGEFTIGELTFSFELPPGAEEASEGAEETLHELVTEPIEIEVASPVDPESSDWALANIKPVTGIRKTKSRTLWWIAGVVLGIGVVLLLALLRKKKRRKAAIRYFKTAHELAYERLWALEDAHLIDAGKIKEYYEGVSYILRWYIEHRFDLRAPEQTTEEFLIAAGQSPELDTAQTGYLQGFLEQCDYVKFAGYAPDPGEAIKTLNSAKEFIDATSAIERRVDVTDLQEDTALHRTPVGSV